MSGGAQLFSVVSGNYCGNPWVFFLHEFMRGPYAAHPQNVHFVVIVVVLLLFAFVRM